MRGSDTQDLFDVLGQGCTREIIPCGLRLCRSLTAQGYQSEWVVGKKAPRDKGHHTGGIVYLIDEPPVQRIRRVITAWGLYRALYNEWVMAVR